jgi:diguanylate cyclase (GGDEF)-like protein
VPSLPGLRTDACRGAVARPRLAAEESINQARTRAAVAFLVLGSLLPLVPIALPGYLRPGAGPIALIASMSFFTLVSAWAFARWGVPSSLVVPIAASADAIVFLTFLTTADRQLATVNLPAIAVAMFFVAVFGTRRDLLVQLVLGNAVVVGGLMIEQRAWPAAVTFLIWSNFGLILPAFAMYGLRAQLNDVRVQAQDAARSDPLTSILNRRGLAELAPDLLRQADQAQLPIAAFVCDLDHFKRINDNYGHAVGDEVLMAVASTLRAATRSTDLVVRLGGEEFVILATVPETEVGRFAERLRSNVAKDCLRWAQTISVGVAWQLPDADDAWESAQSFVWQLIDRADEQTFAAKAAGRNRVELAIVA